MQRRTLLVGATMTGTLAAASVLFRRRSHAHEAHEALVTKSGPLLVARGFACTVIGRSGTRLHDGTTSAEAPDGMACFALPDGKWALLRNHELGRARDEGAFREAPCPFAYDENAHGGVSRLVLDPRTLEVVTSNTILTGTLRNCAGGPSPWGWLSCEEAEDDRHGYVFVCPESADSVRPPERLAGYGRFRHEAVAIDRGTLRAYLTEDQTDGAFYRFTPTDRAQPFAGRLEALRVVGRPGFDVSDELRPGKRLPVDWVPIEDPEAARSTTREQAARAGAAVVRRGEGAWFGDGSVVFCSTSGGPRSLGQILRLRLGERGDTLEVVCEGTDADDLRSPDNVTIAPNGDLVIAEDGGSDARLSGITPAGRIYPIAQNVLSDSELAGVCFSPDGSTLFANLQHDGLTVAIRGPFETLRAV